MNPLLLTLTLVLLISLIAGAPPILPASHPMTKKHSTYVSDPVGIAEGYNKVLFREDFMPFGLSLSRWTYDLGHSYPGGQDSWGTGEVQEYRSLGANIKITGYNTLLITPAKGDDGRWTSGRIETTADHDFGCPEKGKVRIEAGMMLHGRDNQMGIWPAFWTLGSKFRGNYNNWPSVGEINIMENVNGDEFIRHKFHCSPSASGGPCNEPFGIGHSNPVDRGTWLTIELNIDRTNTDGWKGESLTWYVKEDGTNFTLKGGDVGDEDAWAAIAHNSRFLLLNVAVGGEFPSHMAGQTTSDADTIGGLESSLEVDYVTVWST